MYDGGQTEPAVLARDAITPHPHLLWKKLVSQANLRGAGTTGGEFPPACYWGRATAAGDIFWTRMRQTSRWQCDEP